MDDTSISTQTKLGRTRGRQAGNDPRKGPYWTGDEIVFRRGSYPPLAEVSMTIFCPFLRLRCCRLLFVDCIPSSVRRPNAA